MSAMTTYEPPTELGPCGNCGHRVESHEHYRRGTDCSWCECREYLTPQGEKVRQHNGGLILARRGLPQPKRSPLLRLLEWWRR